MPSVSRTVDIQAPLEAVLAVITDFTSYPAFLPQMRKTEVLEAQANVWTVRFHLSLIRALVYTLRLEQLSPTEVRWSLVDGVFRSNDGHWLLEAIAPSSTRATYALDLQVDVFVPSNILRSLVDRSLPDTLDGFRREAERRHAGLPAATTKPPLTNDGP